MLTQAVRPLGLVLEGALARASERAMQLMRPMAGTLATRWVGGAWQMAPKLPARQERLRGRLKLPQPRGLVVHAKLACPCR